MTDKTTPSTGSETAPAPGATPESGAIPEPVADQQEQAGATPPAPEAEGTKLEAALKAERDARRKAQADLAALKKAQDESLPESERLAKRVAELEAANKAAKREALVLKIAAEYSIPSVLSARLHGETEDELRADAETLRAAIPAAPAPTPTVGGPQGPPASKKSPEEWLTTLRNRSRF